MSGAPDFVDEILESPDGRLRVEWMHTDGLMSHVIRTPTVIDKRDGSRLLSMSQGWDADVSWGDRPGVARLSVRHYAAPGAGMRTLTIDADARTFREGGGEPVPLAQFAERFERAFWKDLEREAGAANRAAWRGKLVVIAVMAGLVALTLFVSSRFW